jgi:translation initiation factor IF-3
VISGSGEQLGIMPISNALERAEQEGLDLVEVAPNSSPPVCRIMDYGKYKYQQSKKLHVAKKSQSNFQIKEIRLRPKTEAHDLQVKFRHIQRFLEQGNKVKVSVLFRGREIVYADLGRKLVQDIVEKLGDICVVDQEPRIEGRRMTMILSPRK